MKCPVCKDVDLVMSERQGVEIDYCPSCRGVWLDRGELDKIIEKVQLINQIINNQIIIQTILKMMIEIHIINKIIINNTTLMTIDNKLHTKRKKGFYLKFFDF